MDTGPDGAAGPDGATGNGRTLAQLAEVNVERVRRVGVKRAESLASVGIETVADLLMHYPRRYVDRTRQSEVAELHVGEESVVLAEVTSARFRRTRGGRALVELDVHDSTGALEGRFLQPAVAGEAAAGRHRGALLREARHLQGQATAHESGRRPGR